MLNITGIWSMSVLSTLAAYALNNKTDKFMQCPPLNKPANSKDLVCSHQFAFGSTCDLVCTSGFTRDPSGVSSVKCDATGDWDGELTPCVGAPTSALITSICYEWSSWSPCADCNDAGKGVTKRRRLCLPGTPEFESQTCTTCIACRNKESLSTGPCVCVESSSKGIAKETFLCKEGRTKWKRHSLVACTCDGCSSSPCVNGGTCTPGSSSALYSCACPPKHTGTHCESKVNCSNRDCLNGGLCLANKDRKVCACNSWSQGDRCATPINCTQWELWDCKSCGFNIETRLCYDYWSTMVHLKNVPTSLSDEEVKGLSLSVEGVLTGNMASVSDVGNQKCEWTSWSACALESLPPPSINRCKQVRRRMCFTRNAWFPSKQVDSRQCVCPERHQSAFEAWSEWTSPAHCWPGVCNNPNFRRRQRVEIQWHSGSLRFRDVILDLMLCAPLTCKLPATGVEKSYTTKSWRCEHGMCKPVLRKEQAKAKNYGYSLGINSNSFLISIGGGVGIFVILLTCCLLVMLTRGKKRSKRVRPMPPQMRY